MTNKEMLKTKHFEHRLSLLTSMASPQEIIARTGISYAFKNIQTSVKVVFWFIHN